MNSRGLSFDEPQAKTVGLANAIMGPAFGIFLLVYAAANWWQKRWAVLTLFTIKTPERWQPPAFALVYVAVALGVSWGSAILLTRRKDRLR